MNRRSIFKVIAGVGAAVAGFAGIAKGSKAQAKNFIVGEIAPETVLPQIFVRNHGNGLVGVATHENPDGTWVISISH